MKSLGQSEEWTARLARIAPVLLVLSWFGVLGMAYRDVLSLGPRSKGIDPIEAFFFDTATTIPSLHYALFVLIILNRRHAIRAALGAKPAHFSGVAIAALGLGFFTWAKVTEQIDLEIDSLVLVLAGGALFLGGRRLLDRVVLPLFLLWLARPWPPILTHHLHEWLQGIAGSFAVAILSPFAEVGRSGHLLAFQGRIFEVIEGCSGLRLGVTLVVAILVYLDFVSRSRRQTLGVVLLTIVLTPVFNGLRVVSIMINPASEVSQIHSAQGLLTISLGVVLIAAIDQVLERTLWPEGDRSWRQALVPSSEFRSASVLRWAVPGAVTLLLLGISFAHFERPRNIESSIWALHEIRPRLGAWKRTESMSVDRKFFGSVRFSDKLIRKYTRDGDGRTATLFVTADDRRRRDKCSLSPKTQSLGAGWETIESVPVRIGNPEIEALRSIQQKGNERVLTLHYRIGEGPFLVEMLRWILAVDLWPEFVPDEVITVRIAIPIDPANPVRSLSALNEFHREVWEALVRADPTSRLAPY